MPAAAASTARRLILPSLVPLLLTIVTTTLCYVAAGATTGLFFGGVAFATFLAPPLILARDTFVGRAASAAAVVTGTAMVWAVATGDPYVTAGHWAQCVGALIAYVVCLWGVVALLHRLRLPAVAASAIVVVIAGLWLTWPIWLSPWIAGRDVLVARLTIAHPLLTIDGALITLGPPWTERPLMYNELSVLNQDVAYELPATTTWAVLLHLGIGALALSLAAAPRRAGARPKDVTEVAAPG